MCVVVVVAVGFFVVCVVCFVGFLFVLTLGLVFPTHFFSSPAPSCVEKKYFHTAQKMTAETKPGSV